MEKFDLENFPTSESAKRMLSYVSDGFYDKSYVGKWLYQVMGIEYDEALEKAMELPAQFFVETATWGLMYHEIKWGLPVRANLSYEERRRFIYQKRDYRAPMTPYRMEELIKTATPFQIHVIDVHDSGLLTKNPHMNLSHPNRFIIVLEGEGNADVEKIRELVDRAKQSHTLYDLLYLEESHFEVPVRYSESIRFRTGFYPQFNLPPLYLDSVWSLDGGRNLSGYDSQELADLYPVSVRFGTEAQGVPREDTRIHLQTGIENKAEQAVSVRFPASFYPQFNVPLLYLNGRWSMDGGQTLSGYDSQELMDMYPVSMRFRTEAAEAPEEETRIHMQTSVGSETGFWSRSVISAKSSAECDVKFGQEITVRAGAAEIMEAHTGFHLRGNTEERTGSGGRVFLALSAENRTASGEQMRVRSSAAGVVQAGDITVHIQNYLDDEWTLDGSRNLNGGEELR